MDGKFIESDILLTKNNGKINKLPFSMKGFGGFKDYPLLSQ